MKIDNPHTNDDFEKVDKDAFGKDEYGFRTVDGLEEIVHLPSRKSNMTYYKPEPVVHPEGCNHTFNYTDKAAREIVCIKCNYGITAHITQLHELEGELFVKINEVSYPVN